LASDRHQSLRSDHAGSAPSRIRVYTHNIYARRAGWADRREVLAAGIASMQPDIVLFQEEVCTPEYDQTADLLPLGWNVLHSAARSADEASGISVASRWPIAPIEEVDLTESGPPVDEFEWAALIVNMTTPFGPVVVVNHFPEAAVDRESERERQALMITRRVAATCGPDIPVVLGGDLDAEPHASSLRFLTGLQSLEGESVSYLRTWDAVHPFEPCVTLDPIRNPLTASMRNWPYRQIDHVLVRTGSDGLAALQVETCVLVHDDPTDGIWASDHFGLVVDLPARTSL
jgi:endonuclease/exonuclease/phosphatase family metal-dependent hydrolase